MRRSAFHALALGIAVVIAAPGNATERPLSTDRPDRTESPYSVPKGWLQVESDVITQGEFKEPAGGTITGTSVMTLNAKYGVARNLDVQFLFSPWVSVRAERAGFPDEESSGTGQAGLRLKYNIAGNDLGSAMALLPFAYVPTRGDAIFDSITYGIVAPVSIDLGGDRAMSAMAGVFRLNNDDWWVNGSVSLGTPIAGAFAGFVEIYVARAGFDDNALDDTTFDVGITFAPDPNWQFDTGVYYGITSTTEDWRVFVGASARFDLSHK